MHAGEVGEAPEPWVSKSVKLHAGILSPSSGSNPERLTVTLQGVLSFLNHTFTPRSGLQLAATLIPLNIVSLGLHPAVQTAVYCGSRFTLPSRYLCPFLFIWTHTSFAPLCLPLGILPSPSPPFSSVLLPKASLYSWLSFPRQCCLLFRFLLMARHLLLFWPERKLTSLLYPPVSMAPNPQDFSLWMVHVLGHTSVTRVPLSPLHASLSCTLCDSGNGSSVYQLTEPRTSWPCLPACCSISLARTLQWPSESTLHLASLPNTLNLSDPSGDRDRNTQSSGLSLTTKLVQGQPEIHEAHSQK